MRPLQTANAKRHKTPATTRIGNINTGGELPSVNRDTRNYWNLNYCLTKTSFLTGTFILVSKYHLARFGSKRLTWCIFESYNFLDNQKRPESWIAAIDVFTSQITLDQKVCKRNPADPKLAHQLNWVAKSFIWRNLCVSWSFDLWGIQSFRRGAEEGWVGYGNICGRQTSQVAQSIKYSFRATREERRAEQRERCRVFLDILSAPNSI